jgi:hypothetical protein
MEEPRGTKFRKSNSAASFDHPTPIWISDAVCEETVMDVIT